MVFQTTTVHNWQCRHLNPFAMKAYTDCLILIEPDRSWNSRERYTIATCAGELYYGREDIV